MEAPEQVRAEVMKSITLREATDVRGFGLAGHALKK